MADSDINVDTSSVASIASEIKAQFSTISSTLGKLKQQSRTLGNSWEATEATTFLEHFNEVNTNYENFTTQYGTFMDSLTQFSNDYDGLEDVIVGDIENFNPASGGN